MLLQGNCVKRVLGETSLSLEAKSGESFKIRSIKCKADEADTYLILRVARKTVGVYRTYGRGGNHLGYIGDVGHALNLMDFLAAKGVDVTIPIASGQTFSIDSINALTEIVVCFDRYSEGDITALMPNGSESKEYTFMQYMTSSADLAATGDLLLDVSLSPGEFIDFPCGKVVPANTTVRMVGLVGNPFYNKAFSGLSGKTEYVKLVKDRETLFDVDRHGIPFFGGEPVGFDSSYLHGFSLIGGVWQNPVYDQSPAGDVHENGEPLMFDPALEFVSGEELLVKLTCVYRASYEITVDDIDLAAILHVKTE